MGGLGSQTKCLWGGGGMKKAAAERAESAICHPPLLSLRLSHLPSTPVIWQRGGLPSACMALVPEMFPLCWVPGLGGTAPTSPLSTRCLVMCGAESSARLKAESLRVCVHKSCWCGCRISHARIDKQKLPHFHFLL